MRFRGLDFIRMDFFSLYISRASEFCMYSQKSEAFATVNNAFDFFFLSASHSLHFYFQSLSFSGFFFLLVHFFNNNSSPDIPVRSFHCHDAPVLFFSSHQTLRPDHFILESLYFIRVREKKCFSTNRACVQLPRNPRSCRALCSFEYYRDTRYDLNYLYISMNVVAFFMASLFQTRFAWDLLRFCFKLRIRFWSPTSKNRNRCFSSLFSFSLLESLGTIKAHWFCSFDHKL